MTSAVFQSLRFASLLGVLSVVRPVMADDRQPVVDEPLSPAEAAQTMQVPDGFHVTLFAGEPDVKQPIGFCLDDRGRLWVAEAYNYPDHGTKPGDRIIILEDTDGDGRHDKRTVFYDGLNYVTGVEVGFGGAWVMSPPYFYFIPDRDGDDQPDGPPQVLLDGFGNHANSHNLANGFAWGPDGWLYATHGRTNWSKIGKPGTPEAERSQYDGGVWRYHPIRNVWEPYADGTTNPWGIDWDDHGQAFVCNCVNPHLFHVIPGAHYEPWRDRESSCYAYARIDTIADHLHFTGAWNDHEGFSEDEDAIGGGHAHCGTMVYLGDNWPDRYRNGVFMHNIHGKRINHDILRRSGSGYLASHGPDLMRSQDPWYVGVTLAYGPDGAVYTSDWSDTGECHHTKNTRRETGRIFRITWGQSYFRPVNVAALSDDELVQLHLHHNDWFVRHARRNLEERFAAGKDLKDVRTELHRMFEDNLEETRKLRALWTLHALGGLNDEFLVRQLDHANEHVRAWSVCLLCEDRQPPADALARFRELAASGDSALVRLHLASALQRLSPESRWAIAAALVGRAEDAEDSNLPLMDWYAIEPLVESDLARFVALAEAAEIPLVRRHIARRAASLDGTDKGLTAVTGLLARTRDPAAQLDLLEGILTGLEGRRTVVMPPDWTAAYASLRESGSEPVRKQATRLALVFDDPVALRSLRTVAGDKTAVPAERIDAIEALVSKRPSDFAPLLLALLDEPPLRGSVLRGLAEYEHPGTSAAILKLYPSLDATDCQHALQTLASRRTWATDLLDAVEAKTIPRADLTAYTARQLGSLGDKKLTARVESIWGNVRETSADRAKLIAKLKKNLTPEVLASADLSSGRATFQKLCANCHKLFDAGGAIGPDITGSQRRNLDYVLENLIDPSAAVAKDFQMEVIVTDAGRVVTGLVVEQTDAAITVATVNEKLVIPLNEIDSRTVSPVSMMPEGQLNPLSADQIRDLIAYLASPRQVTLPETQSHP